MSHTPVLLNPEHHWECISCGRQEVTRTPGKVVTPLHPCKAHNGLDVPYTEVPPGKQELRKHAARHVLREREDYIGQEVVRYHNGRPIMALVTERADGSNDARVYAPVAQARLA